MKTKNILLWSCRILAALIMLQTLYYKFSGAKESIYIFSKIGIEPWGRIGTGVAELIAAILILMPRTSVFGAAMAIGIMAGALVTHVFIIGIIVMDDHGQLFIYAMTVLLCSMYVLWVQRQQLFTLVKSFAA
jgi:uncharacterized membrane protein YphA (DoxX/SURF4 family)